MAVIYFLVLLFYFFNFCGGSSFHDQYKVPHSCSDKTETYVFNGKEYLLQNLPVTWENANILCRGYHNGSLADLDTKEKAEFVAEALSESQLMMESVWVGARRAGPDDPAGYRWGAGPELRRTALDVLAADDRDVDKHYPLWLNRTHVPVPEGGADCVAVERVAHDKPVFVDLPCHLERAFVCERDARPQLKVTELRAVRCRTGLYRVFGGGMDWHQAAAYCVINKMSLANIATLRCLKKLGMTMLKTRPSIESAWVGARGAGGAWRWLDSGASILTPAPYSDAAPGAWPPMRDLTSIKPNGCLQLDRHVTHPPIFLEGRCERKLPFICYQSAPLLRTAQQPFSDDNYNYLLVREQLPWQQAYDNCIKLRGMLATVDNNDILIQLLLVMGESQNEPIDHIWVAGHLNMTRDEGSGALIYSWYNPITRRRIPDSKTAETSTGVNLPWLDEEFSMDSSCLNLDRQDHLKGLVYGLPCDTPQYSICMIEKAPKQTVIDNITTVVVTEQVATAGIDVDANST